MKNMSNYKLNLAIMTMLGLVPIENWKTSYDNGVATSECTFKANPTDYCTNWSDLMPLVVEHEISIDYFEEGLSAMHPDSHVCNKDPQRALAECLFKVLESKRIRSEAFIKAANTVLEMVRAEENLNE